MQQSLTAEDDSDQRVDCMFRLGMVYKRLHRYQEALHCFEELGTRMQKCTILQEGNLPRLRQKLSAQRATMSQLCSDDCFATDRAALADGIAATQLRISAASSLSVLWYEIAHTHELQAKYYHAKQAYEKVLIYHPQQSHALHRLGWIYHHVPRVDRDVDATPSVSTRFHLSQRKADESASNCTTAAQQLIAISYLERSIAVNDSQHSVWYLLGCCYTRQKEYKKAYWALEHAIALETNEPIYWGSIGNLYYFNSQYHEALDTYARALQLNPDCAEMWLACNGCPLFFAD
eukprot:COSAG05_NODE_434_length_9856_cov_1158.820027_5_plen_290_part_00